MEELQAGLKLMHAGCFMLPQPYVWSLEGTLDHMDRCGIAMQLLSNIPRAVPALQESNDYGAELVGRYPTRFGLLAAIPTHDPDVALAEIKRSDTLQADGCAVTCCYNDVYLGDARLRPVWAELNRRGATVFHAPQRLCAALARSAEPAPGSRLRDGPHRR